jgi:hypothetical protein
VILPGSARQSPLRSAAPSLSAPFRSRLEPRRSPATEGYILFFHRAASPARTTPSSTQKTSSLYRKPAPPLTVAPPTHRPLLLTLHRSLPWPGNYSRGGRGRHRQVRGWGCCRTGWSGRRSGPATTSTHGGPSTPTPTTVRSSTAFSCDVWTDGADPIAPPPLLVHAGVGQAARPEIVDLTRILGPRRGQ